MDEYSPPTSPQSDSNIQRDRLAQKQVELAFGHIPLALTFVFLAAVITTLLLQRRVDQSSLAAWLGFLVLILVLRLGLYLAYQRRKPVVRPLRWIVLYSLNTGLSGVAWGLLLPVFGPTLSEPYQCFLLLLLGGAVGTGCVFQASIYPSCVALVLPATVPTILLLSLFGLETIHLAVMVLIILFSAVSLLLAWRMNKAITTSTTLEFKTEAILSSLQKSEERFRALTENSAAAYFIVQDQRFVYLNPTGEKLLGYSLAEARKMDFVDFVHPEHREMVRGRATRRFQGEAVGDLPSRYEFMLQHRDGHVVWVDYTPGIIEIDGRVAILGTVFDITDKKRAEKRLQISEKRFRMLFNRANDPMFLLEVGDEISIGVLKDVNEAACEALGYSREELLAIPTAEIFDEDNPNLFRAILAKLSVDGKIVFETELKTKKDANLPVEISAQMSSFVGTTIIHAIARDISLKKQLMEKLTELANTDPLTGCLNRRSFWNRGAGELDRSKRYERPLVLLMIDIDHFKTINDTHGHSMGDVVLRSLVARCQAELRATDLFGRIGGEEFAALLLETDVNEARVVAERIRTTLEQTRTSYGPSSVSCTVSIGLAAAVAEDARLDDLVHRADEALYHAKETGRNRVVVHEEMPQSS